MQKRRILFCSEWTELSSGFATYYKKLITHLFNTGKYEVLELANYAKEGDPRLVNSPWEVIPVMPQDGDEDGHRIYNSNPLAQFGLFKFEQACLDFRPDIVISIFDYWYSSFVLKSPYRRFFKFIWMPTVDSRPQRTAWLDTFSLCDKVCAYSYFGKKVLEEESCGKIKDLEVCSAGIDDSYNASDSKENLRAKFGIPSDAKLISMVCRNQMRKLIPDFIESASTFRARYISSDKALVDNTYFHLHTSNPDSGWEIERLIADSPAAKNILLTYRCAACGQVLVCNYKGVVFDCPACKKYAMQSVSVTNGVDRQTLADIMKMADFGALMSIGEGFGMPIIEFKKVGVPVFMPPWSAMEEQCTEVNGIRHYGGIPVKIQRFFTESATMQKRALFDVNDFVKKIYCHINMSDSERRILSEQAVECVEKEFTWEKSCNKWEEIVDEIDISDNMDWTNSTPIIYSNTLSKEIVPEELRGDIVGLVNWAIDNFYPHNYFTKYRRLELVNSIVCGVEMIDQFSKNPFNLDSFIGIINAMIQKHNNCEMARYEKYQANFVEKKEEVFNAVVI